MTAKRIDLITINDAEGIITAKRDDGHVGVPMIINDGKADWPFALFGFAARRSPLLVYPPVDY